MRSSTSFAGPGMKRAWYKWKQYDELTNVLDYISVSPSQENVNTAFSTLERFPVLLPDRTSTCTSINVGKIYFPEKVDYQKIFLLL